MAAGQSWRCREGFSNSHPPVFSDREPLASVIHGFARPGVGHRGSLSALRIASSPDWATSTAVSSYWTVKAGSAKEGFIKTIAGTFGYISVAKLGNLFQMWGVRLVFQTNVIEQIRIDSNELI